MHTFMPAKASRSATLRPAHPPPIIITSNFIPVDLLHILRFPQGISPQHGCNPLPAFLQIIVHKFLGINPEFPTKDLCHFLYAERALAGSHANSRVPAQVGYIPYAELLDSIRDFGSRDMLTLAYYLSAVVEIHPGHLFAMTAYGCTDIERVNKSRFTAFGTRKMACSGLAAGLGADFFADKIRRHLRHKAGGGEFPPGDGYESRDPVSCLMVEQDYAATDITSVSSRISNHQRTYAGVGTYDSGMGKARDQLLAFAQQQFYLLRCGMHIVACLDRNFVRCRAKDADNISRNKYISVGRLAATVDDMPRDPVSEDDQGAFTGHHAYVYARFAGKPRCPYACRQDDFPRPKDISLRRTDTDYTAVLLYQAGDSGKFQDVRPVASGVQDIGIHQTERIHGCIRHFDSPDYPGIDRRLHPQRLGRIDCLGVDSGFAAFLNEVRLIVQTIFGKRYEKPFGRLYAVGSYPAQDAVFTYAFLGTFPVGNSIACSAVKQTVIPAGRTVADVSPLYQK